MKKIKILALFSLLILSLLVIAGCGQDKNDNKASKEPATQKEQPKQAENKTNGEIVYVDSTKYPDACASCHVKISAEKDYSLNAKIKKIPNHPKVEANKVSECAACHKAQSPDGLKKVIHKAHFQSKDQIFVKEYNGSCVQCHKLAQDGVMQIPGLAPEGTKFVPIKAAQVDKAPNGCLDCHKKVSDDKDYSLPTILSKKPNHPKIEKVDIKACISCHKANGKPLYTILHPAHLTSKTYQDNYGGSCLNCHKK